MGAYPARARFWLDHRAMIANAERLIARVGLSVDVRAPMRELSVAQEQMVQIAAALAGGGRALIFDEPTSSLSVIESQRLFALIEELRRAGVTMLYVSHRMPEVFRLCDRISVLRDGRHVATVARADTSEREIVQMMVGREVVPNARRGGEPPLADTPPALGVRGLTSPGRFGDITFEVRPGEIVGVAGLVGSGRSEVAQAIFGLDRSARGEVKVAGEPVRLGRVRHAMRCGVALVPEDRKRQGLVMGMSCVANHTLANLASLSRWGWLMHGRAWRDADGYFKRLALKAPSWDAAVHTLSGGNQQKVVLSKWLCRGAKVLIVDEPTRGVDVAAKASIHSLLRELAGGGVAVLMISSELPEVLSLADRVLVMRGGRLVGELPGMHATEESVLRLMVGVG